MNTIIILTLFLVLVFLYVINQDMYKCRGGIFPPEERQRRMVESIDKNDKMET